MGQIEISWVRQGDVIWNEDWVELHGHQRSKLPELQDHIGFANYDLRAAGLPEISELEDGTLTIVFDECQVTGLPRNAGIMLLHSAAVKTLLAVIEPHGFSLSHRRGA